MCENEGERPYGQLSLYGLLVLASRWRVASWPTSRLVALQRHNLFDGTRNNSWCIRRGLETRNCMLPGAQRAGLKKLASWERLSQRRRSYTGIYSSLLSSSNAKQTFCLFDTSLSSSSVWIHASEAAASQPIPVELHQPNENTSETMVGLHDWCFQGFDSIDTDFFGRESNR